MAADTELMAAEIVKAAGKAFRQLFENGESYYYCTLITTGEALAPTVSAWTWEALARVTQQNPQDAYWLKWSYGDSPYWLAGDEYFATVKKMFSERTPVDYLHLPAYWEDEVPPRLQAMEQAMMELDRQGIFSLNQPRDAVCIHVEMMPPDAGNTQRALRLNQPQSQAMQAWLAEAAE